MSVRGEVKEFVVGVNVAAKAREEVMRAEAKVAHSARQHGRTMEMLAKGVTKLEGAIMEREAEIAALGERRNELSAGVTLQEAIVRSRTGGEGGTTLRKTGGASVESDGGRMRGIASRAALRTLAKKQVDDMAAARAEIARLELRNFPSLPSGGGKVTEGSTRVMLTTSAGAASRRK